MCFNVMLEVVCMLTVRSRLSMCEIGRGSTDRHCLQAQI